MLIILTANPNNWAGINNVSPIINSINNQLPIPKTMANKAPWLVERFQKTPKTNGTKAPANVTLYADSTMPKIESSELSA